MTPDGHLLDGRNRWRACAQAGKKPLTREEASEPWAFVISTNVHRRHLNESQRAMIAAKIAKRTPGQHGPVKGTVSPDTVPDPLPPSRDRAAELFNVSTASIARAREVRTGTPALQQVVESGRVPVYTAARVARELPHEQQDEFVRLVETGVDPAKLAPPDTYARKSRERRKARDQKSPDPATAARTDNRSPGRHRYLTVATLRSLRDSLSALDMVLKSTPDGLDPAITDEEAARWANDLSKGRGALHRAITLLKNHKEPTP
jgi:hypothetical protein